MKMLDEFKITSLLDTDYYKLTMSQLFQEKWPNEIATFNFINRTDINLANVLSIDKDFNIDYIRSGLESYSKLTLTSKERKFLEAQGIFSQSYLDWLESGADLDKVEIKVEDKDGDLHMTFTGPWASATLFEVPALAIVSDTYYTAIFFNKIKEYSEGKGNPPKIGNLYAAKIKLQEKIDKLIDGVKFVDFGTRRRYGKDWQNKVIEECINYASNNFVGTSNVYYAMRYNIPVVGTMAHECFMGYSRLFGDSEEDIRRSHSEFLNDWWEMYGEKLSIALTDTFGTKFFFEDFAPHAEKWKGIRQDSGDPYKFGESAIKFYEDLGIDPKEKMLVFSDGLNFEKMVDLYRAFGNRIQVSFGIGTNLTNDVGEDPISIVVKLSEINGKNTVKLSDNIAKATGNVDTVKKFKDIFDYDVNYYEKTVY